MVRTILITVVCIALLIRLTDYVERPVLIENAHVITMDQTAPVADSLLLHGDRIAAVGSQQVNRYLEELDTSGGISAILRLGNLLSVQRIDIQGRTVLPGFIDAHSHFPASGLASTGLNLSPEHEQIKTIDELLSRLSEASRQHPTSRWLLGFNYDNALLEESRHPTREELDRAAPEHAVYLWHRSGHMGVANSQALIELGYDPTRIGPQLNLPVGGAAGRDEWGRLNGLLQEKAAPGLRRLIHEIPIWKLPAVFFAARDDYLSVGVTTVQNGYADRTIMRILSWAQRLRLLKQRVVLWPAHNKLTDNSLLRADVQSSEMGMAGPAQTLAEWIGWPQTQQQRIAISAIKLIADGSPQGRTAYMTRPYLPHPAVCNHYRGIPIVPEAQLHEQILQYHQAGVQLAIHGNGDAAIDSIISGLQAAQEKAPRVDARHMIVHAQTIRQDQLQALSDLQATVSFFPSHTYYWGDWYRHQIFGEFRARRISPLKSADENGVRYSLHSDSPVTAMRPMQMLWSATNRRTLSGYELGPDEIIDRQRALRALTIDAAWQSFLEHDRGSLEAGKLADLIVLSENPLTAADVRRIDVEQVWIGGSRVYTKAAIPAREVR